MISKESIHPAAKKIVCGYCKWETPRVCTIHDKTNKAKAGCPHFVNVFSENDKQQPKDFNYE